MKISETSTYFKIKDQVLLLVTIIGTISSHQIADWFGISIEHAKVIVDRLKKAKLLQSAMSKGVPIPKINRLTSDGKSLVQALISSIPELDDKSITWYEVFLNKRYRLLSSRLYMHNNYVNDHMLNLLKTTDFVDISYENSCVPLKINNKQTLIPDAMLSNGNHQFYLEQDLNTCTNSVLVNKLSTYGQYFASKTQANIVLLSVDDSDPVLIKPSKKNLKLAMKKLDSYNMIYDVIKSKKEFYTPQYSIAYEYFTQPLDKLNPGEKDKHDAFRIGSSSLPQFLEILKSLENSIEEERNLCNASIEKAKTARVQKINRRIKRITEQILQISMLDYVKFPSDEYYIKNILLKSNNLYINSNSQNYIVLNKYFAKEPRTIDVVFEEFLKVNATLNPEVEPDFSIIQLSLDRTIGSEKSFLGIGENAMAKMCFFDDCSNGNVSALTRIFDNIKHSTSLEFTLYQVVIIDEGSPSKEKIIDYANKNDFPKSRLIFREVT